MSNTLGMLNPLRYRGYVYDTETSLYYLQSRYYNPDLGRFLNPDAFTSTGQGLLGNNMFAYCLNNPVAYMDSTGTSVTAVVVGCVVSVAINVVSSWGIAMIMGEEYTWVDACVAVVTGVAGYFSPVAEGLLTAAYAGYTTYDKGGSTAEVVATVIVSGFLSGMLPGNMAKGTDTLVKTAGNSIFGFSYGLITASASKSFTADNSSAKGNNSLNYRLLTRAELYRCDPVHSLRKALNNAAKRGPASSNGPTSRQYTSSFENGRKYIM